MKALIVGDIIGKPGRTILKKYLEKNISNYDLVIVNGENSAGGFGITQSIAEEFYDMGVDAITTGNHVWDKKEVYSYLDEESRIVRPLNYPIGAPGQGYSILKDKNGDNFAIINLQGRVFMQDIDCPFKRVEEILPEIKKQAKNIIVDFHAEATSEKMAMGWFLDGEVSLVFGTHTHVLTADHRLLKQGTGFITDVGMTGGFDGVIGMKKETVLQKFLTSLPNRFEVCGDNSRLNGIEVSLNSKIGNCLGIKLINVGINDI